MITVSGCVRPARGSVQGLGVLFGFGVRFRVVGLMGFVRGLIRDFDGHCSQMCQDLIRDWGLGCAGARARIEVFWYLQEVELAQVVRARGQQDNQDYKKIPPLKKLGLK